MSENTDTLKDDIAFMRALAQEGRRAPLLGGACLLAAGLLFSAATLVSWGMTAGLIILPSFWYLGVWWSRRSPSTASWRPCWSPGGGPPNRARRALATGRFVGPGARAAGR